MFNIHGWRNAYKSASTCFFESLVSGFYSHNQFMEAIAVCVKTLEVFIHAAVVSRADMFEGVPDSLLDSVQEFIEEVLDFYETLCLLAQNSSLKFADEVGELVPLELVFTKSGEFICTTWYNINPGFDKSKMAGLFFTLRQCGGVMKTFQTWSCSARLESVADNNVRRYPIPLAPTLSLHKTFSNVLCDLVKSFFAKKKHAHINTRAGTYVGSDKFADFVVNAKVGSLLVLFDQNCGDECVDFLANGGFEAFVQSKVASSTTFKALAYLSILDRETLKLLCLKAFYGPYLASYCCPYV